MKLKHITLIFLAFLTLLCISAVSAENVTDISADDSANVTEDIEIPQETEIAQTTKTVEKTPVKKIKTDVDADSIVVVHKKKSYFKVKVKNDKTDKAVKNLKLKIKIYTKSKSKTYTVKTNSKGIAKFNTKNLKVGNHKVVITSGDDKYKVSKKAKIFVGKKHTVTLKPGTHKKLKNKDTLRVYKKYDDDDIEVKVAFKGTPKKTNILKAVFYFKNKYTGKIVKKVEYTDFDDGKWDYPDRDCSYRYVPLKVKITYVTI